MNVKSTLPNDLGKMKQLLLQALSTQIYHKKIINQYKQQLEKQKSLIEQKYHRIEILESELCLQRENTYSFCHNTMPAIKNDELKQLAIIPAQYYVIRHIRKHYAYPCKRTVNKAKIPKQVIPKSQTSPQLLTYLMVSKFLDAPATYEYRQEHSLPIWKAFHICRNYKIIYVD